MGKDNGTYASPYPDVVPNPQFNPNANTIPSYSGTGTTPSNPPKRPNPQVSNSGTVGSLTGFGNPKESGPDTSVPFDQTANFGSNSSNADGGSGLTGFGNKAESGPDTSVPFNTPSQTGGANSSYYNQTSGPGNSNNNRTNNLFDNRPGQNSVSGGLPSGHGGLTRYGQAENRPNPFHSNNSFNHPSENSPHYAPPSEPYPDHPHDRPQHHSENPPPTHYNPPPEKPPGYESDVIKKNDEALMDIFTRPDSQPGFQQQRHGQGHGHSHGTLLGGMDSLGSRPQVGGQYHDQSDSRYGDQTNEGRTW